MSKEYWLESSPINLNLRQLKAVYKRLLPKVDYIPTTNWSEIKLTESQAQVVEYVKEHLKSGDSNPLRCIITGSAGIIVNTCY